MKPEKCLESNSVLFRCAIAAMSTAAVMLAGCGSTPKKDPLADRAQEELTSLRSDPNLSSRAEVAIKDAETAVNAAQVPQEDPAYARHMAYVAEGKVQTAKSLAEARYAQDQFKSLSDRRQQVQLDARTAEADQLKKQLSDLKARQTDRGIVFTLGDVLFATGKADLKPGAAANLDKLAAFLNQYPDRHVSIEGHTDSVGDEDYNQELSQHRADAVKSYLVARSVPDDRITSIGKGEALPVASNKTSAGRQQNRRVEVVVENPTNAATTPPPMSVAPAQTQSE